MNRAIRVLTSLTQAKSIPYTVDWLERKSRFFGSATSGRLAVFHNNSTPVRCSASAVYTFSSLTGKRTAASLRGCTIVRCKTIRLGWSFIIYIVSKGSMCTSRRRIFLWYIKVNF